VLTGGGGVGGPLQDRADLVRRAHAVRTRRRCP
jgi:hypothetical protein